MSDLSYTAMIFARGGSKGVKKKNIRDLAGQPLIAYSIKSALASRDISNVVVSTDDAEIAEVAKSYGAEILMRPQELAEDKTPEIFAWRHAIDSLPYIYGDGGQDLFISLPTTTPLRQPEDINEAIDRYLVDDCDIVFGITPSHRNPYLNMVTVDADNLLHIAISGSDAVNRQGAPEVFDITTAVYITNIDYVRNCQKLIDGRVGGSFIPPERSIDIDTEYDLYLADLMIRNPFNRGL